MTRFASTSLTLSLSPPSACYFNQDMLMHYHPGALSRGVWSCCRQRGRNSLGCQPTYHLLTRSSSRYAQMRRKDTLTSSHHRCSRASPGRFTQPSSTTGNKTNIADTAAQGLSNSCLELVETPSLINADLTSPLLPRCSSPESSHFSSANPSVSLGSITLTRVSVAGSGARTSSCSSSNDSRLGAAEGEVEGRQRLCEPRLVQTWDRRINRSQVAPETQPMALNTFPPEFKRKAGPRVRSASEVLSQTLTGSFSSSVSISPSVPPITERRGERSAAGAALMKHSKTFVVSASVSVNRPAHLSHSTSALLRTRPVIEPRVSPADPNIIHV